VEDASVTAGRVMFDLAAAAAIVFSGLMVVGRNPVRSVLSLVVAFFALAVCFVLLLAPFIAALQVIVYAGAILVLFLFVLMLLNVGREPPEKTGRPIQTVLGSAGVLVFAGLLLGMFRGSGAHVPASADPVAPSMLGDPAALARLLFSDYLLHFEAISVLLLAALVGAFVLARRENAS
jgi:NADH-quinone oxidoreductase subunit J